MADASPLLVENSGDGVLLLTLNRPAVRNAINLELAEAIARALDRLDSDDALRVGVIAGAGNGFCAGMDLAAFAQTGTRPWVSGRGFAGIVQQPPEKPIVAAIEGFAVAGGLEIALACDLIVAAKGARLGIPEVKRGLVAAGGALRRLPERMPHGIAMELALTGELISAEQAYDWGLVNRLAEPHSAVDVARELARAIAANAPLATAASKAVLRRQRSWNDTEFFAFQADIVDPVMASEDAREGARAFKEKRDPVWRSN